MPCFYPIPAVRDAAGIRLHPKPDEEVGYWLKCGKCLGCRDLRASEWAIRLKHETRSHSHNTFLTLTYDDEHLPTDGGLRRYDLQMFWARLRKAVPATIKYYACGEYGDRTHRAHYHAAVFGFHVNHWKDAKIYDTVNTHSETLTAIWGKGRVLTSELTYNRMKYVTGYVLKKSGYRKQTYCNEDGEVLENPFQLMSKGLGAQWIAKYATDVQHGYLVTEGAKVAIPRYYKQWLKVIEPELAQRVADKAEERRAALPDPDPARLRAAEEIKRQLRKNAARHKSL